VRSASRSGRADSHGRGPRCGDEPDHPGPGTPLCSPPLTHRTSRRKAADLSARERELVTLVARGRIDAQIAAELFISVRTVSSYLDRIRGKTGGLV
jgi:DNA-binding CsgD family transcriptional regulator